MWCMLYGIWSELWVSADSRSPRWGTLDALRLVIRGFQVNGSGNAFPIPGVFLKYITRFKKLIDRMSTFHKDKIKPAFKKI